MGTIFVTISVLISRGLVSGPKSSLRSRKMSSPQSCSHRSSAQNGPIDKLTALTGTTFVTISGFMSRRAVYLISDISYHVLQGRTGNRYVVVLSRPFLFFLFLKLFTQNKTRPECRLESLHDRTTESAVFYFVLLARENDHPVA